MGHTDTKWIRAGGYALESYVLRSPHTLIRQLNVKFRPSSNGEYFDMSYEAIEKDSSAHIRPQPEGSFRISKEQYLMLMRSIGDRKNVESVCLQYLWPSDKLDSVFPGLFLSCSGGFSQLCRALCTNRTMSTLQIQLSGKALDVLALSQAFDTNGSSPRQLLTIDPVEKRMMEVPIAMRLAKLDFASLLCHNKALQTIQIQSDENSAQDWVKLVRPLTKDLDVQEADVQQQSHVDLAKLHATISGSAVPAAVCNLVFPEVFQSSTLKELTVETADRFGHTLDPSCALLQALVRPLIADEAGQEAKANLSKLTLVLPHVRVNGSWSRAIFAEILPELLQRNSTLKELTVKAPQFYELREETRVEKLCALSLEFAELCRALCTNSTMSTLQIQLSDKAPYEGFQDQVTLVRPLTTDSDGLQANVDLAKLNVTILGSRMCGECDLVFHEVLQSSTLKELTVETSDNYKHMLDSSRSCALLQALVRPLIADEAGQEAKANLSKLTLVLPHVRVNGSWSRAIFAEILPELLQRNSTLKELTVKAPQFYELREETRVEKLCALSLEFAELCRALCTNSTMSTLQIQLSDKAPYEGFQDQVTLVRPLTTDSDGLQANVDLAKLNVTILGSRMCGECDLVFHEVLQSSTLKELTVETSDNYKHMLDSSRSCALLQALVRPLIADEAGQEAKANLSKLTLVLPHVRVNGSWSRAIFAEILPELLQRNSTLKELTVKAPQFYELREETRVEKLCALSLEFAELCRALCTNSTMSTLQIQLSDKAPYEGFQDQVTLVRPLTTDSDGQQANVDLAKLNVTISGSRMCGECDLVFHEVLQSSTLKELTVETSDNYKHMLDSSRSCALLQALVRPLIADEAGQEAKANLSKLTLVLPHVRVNGSWSRAIFAEILPELLQRNSTLKELTVKAPQFIELREETREEKLCALLQSLKENKSLEILDLSECQGILTQRVIPTLMDILLVNFTLRHINFGDSSIWYGVKEQLRKNEKYMQSSLTKLPVAKAQAARVFLCGGPYAGKTTLRKILIRCSEPGSKFRKTYLSPCKDLMIKSHDGIQKLWHGRLQLARRTRGIEICGLKNNAGIWLSIWDMGGQEEYHAFHDFMFPNLSDTGNPSSFLLVCNPFTSVYMDAKKQPEDVSQELEYWLRFIASNTRKSVSFKPKVHVVLTHADKVAGLAAWAKGIVTQLQRKFCDALDLSPEPMAVNATSSHSSNSIACLIQDNTQAILEKLPPVYEVCSVMRLVLADWRVQHPECPLISWQRFSDLCQDTQVPDFITYLEGYGPEYLLVKERRKAVAECLHDAGDIIFFNDLDFIVVDLHWFCHRVMGHLIRLSRDKFKDHSSMGSPADGFTTREYLEAILNDSLKTSRDLGRHGGSMQSVKAETLVKLMLRLELCFERTTGSLDDGLFIPMTLARESGCLWHWPKSNCDFQCNITKVVQFGRRLQCDDQECTFIPPGLFCRLQVSLHNKFLGPSNRMTADYFLEKDLILIVFNGVEIVLEYHGNVGTHIDVLVRSNSMSFDDALEIVHEHVMTHVQELCVSSGGCQGVLLVEGIVRPECVRQQMSFMQRQNQAVLVEDLKVAMEASGSRMRSYQHTWSRLKEGDRVILDSSCEAAMDLLGSKEKEDVERRLRELQHSKGYDHTMNPLGGLTSSILEAQDSTFPKPVFSGESFKVLVPSSGDNRNNVQRPLPQDPMSSHPDIVLQKIEDLSIHIRHLDERLCPLTKHIIDFFVKSSQHQVPRIVLFTNNDASMKQRLVTKFVPGMKALRLHLLCEYKTHVHKVEGKHGCEVILQEKEWEEIHGLVLEGLKWVFLAIKVGAHITLGIGDLVPNPSRAYTKAVSDSVGSHLPRDWATVTPQELVMDAASAVRTAHKESAEQWLVDFLKDKSILKEFGLQRVIYKDEQTAEVGWICEEHLKKGEQSGQLARLPCGGTGL